MFFDTQSFCLRIARGFHLGLFYFVGINNLYIFVALNTISTIKKKQFSVRYTTAGILPHSGYKALLRSRIVKCTLEIIAKHSAEFSPIASQDLRYKFDGCNKVPGNRTGECQWGMNAYVVTVSSSIVAGKYMPHA